MHVQYRALFFSIFIHSFILDKCFILVIVRGYFHIIQHVRFKRSSFSKIARPHEYLKTLYIPVVRMRRNV